MKDIVYPVGGSLYLDVSKNEIDPDDEFGGLILTEEQYHLIQMSCELKTPCVFCYPFPSNGSFDKTKPAVTVPVIWNIDGDGNYYVPFPGMGSETPPAFYLTGDHLYPYTI